MQEITKKQRKDFFSQLLTMRQSAVSQAIFDKEDRPTRIKIMDFAPKIVKKEDKN